MAAKTTSNPECSTKTVIYEAYRHAEKSGAMISRLRWLRPPATKFTNNYNTLAPHGALFAFVSKRTVLRWCYVLGDDRPRPLAELADMDLPSACTLKAELAVTCSPKNFSISVSIFQCESLGGGRVEMHWNIKVQGNAKGILHQAGRSKYGGRKHLQYG
tara:strand:+ start:7285 stop:7761 length:477 start_codon:yes stop_codon:yes gene_type:complete